MFVIDNAIKQLWRDGTKIKRIWANASPTSNFGEQNIPVDTSEYDFITFGLKGAASTPGATGGGTVTLTTKGETAQLLIENSAKMQKRPFTWIDNDSVYIGDCVTTQTYSSVGSRVNSNNSSIPVVLYGIKLLGGGRALIEKIKSLFSIPERGCA